MLNLLRLSAAQMRAKNTEANCNSGVIIDQARPQKLLSISAAKNTAKNGSSTDSSIWPINFSKIFREILTPKYI